MILDAFARFIARLHYGQPVVPHSPLACLLRMYRAVPRLAVKLRLRVHRPPLGFLGWAGPGVTLGETFLWEGTGRLEAEVMVPRARWARHFAPGILTTLVHEAAHLYTKEPGHSLLWRMAYRSILHQVFGAHISASWLLTLDPDQACQTLALEVPGGFREPRVTFRRGKVPQGGPR